MKLYCRNLLILLVLWWTLEPIAPVWADQNILAYDKSQYVFSLNNEINLLKEPTSFKSYDLEKQDFENSLVIGEVLAGTFFTLFLSPVIMGIYIVVGYDSDSSIKGPLGILGASAFNAFSLASAITLAGNIDRERGDYWETWEAAMIGNAVSSLLILAVVGPRSQRQTINELTTGLVISAAFLIPLTFAVLGFNLSVDRKQAAEILEKTQIGSNGISYRLLSF